MEKSCIKTRDKTFLKITALLNEINEKTAAFGVKFETRTEYAIEYAEQITEQYKRLFNIDSKVIVKGRGHRRTTERHYYKKLAEYTEKLKKYSNHIRICGENRNSYSKTDNDAAFMRMKKDYMGNDQLLPGCNIQLGVCDEIHCSIRC